MAEGTKIMRSSQACRRNARPLLYERGRLARYRTHGRIRSVGDVGGASPYTMPVDRKNRGHPVSADGQDAETLVPISGMSDRCSMPCCHCGRRCRPRFFHARSRRIAEGLSQQGKKEPDHLAECLGVKPLGFRHEDFPILISPHSRNPLQSNSFFRSHRMSPFCCHASGMLVFQLS